MHILKDINEIRKFKETVIIYIFTKLLGFRTLDHSMISIQMMLKCKQSRESDNIIIKEDRRYMRNSSLILVLWKVAQAIITSQITRDDCNETQVTKKLGDNDKVLAWS